MTQQRFHGLDFLRALMMTLGVVLHGAQMYMTMDLGFDYYRDAQQSLSMDAVLIFINTFRMPVFFMLSGFFAALLVARYGVQGMLKNRFKRLAIPFLVFLPPIAISLTPLWILNCNRAATGHYGWDLAHVPYPELIYNNTHQLWFVYYLMMLVLTTAMLLWCGSFLSSSIKSWFDGGLRYMAKHYLIGVILAGLLLGYFGSYSSDGRINGSMFFNPSLLVYANFGLCFSLGWFLYHRQQLLPIFEKHTWSLLFAAMLCFSIALASFLTMGERQSPDHRLYHTFLSYSNGLSVAFFMCGFVGLFGRYFSSHNLWVRYFADSAYWVFLVHQTLLVVLAMPISDWQITAEFKFLIVTTGAIAIAMVTYHYWVRSTWVGEMLNGRRYLRKTGEQKRVDANG